MKNLLEKIKLPNFGEINRRTVHCACVFSGLAFNACLWLVAANSAEGGVIKGLALTALIVWFIASIFTVDDWRRLSDNDK